MKRNLSSFWNAFYKFIVFPIWLGSWLFGAFINFASEDRVSQLFGWVGLATALLATPSLYVYCWCLKNVSVDDEYLYVSDYFKQICIPLSDVDLITETLFALPKHVTITLKKKSEFGLKIRFIPVGLILATFSSYPTPVVRDLRRMIQSIKLKT